ncbi:flavodoxin family protein [Clostridium sp. AN503]|uniref:flavodoxin family protein n=1 Tax=Clostridium sp. AN503 TaxID=3160598 RepID=UPI0034594131
MKVLLSNGSPHADGCTHAALSEAAGALEREGIGTEIVHIGADKTHGCMGCGGCGVSGFCVHEDDRLNEVIGKLDGIDGLVVGSPVHYAAAAGAVSCFLDRLFTAAPGKLAFKPAACVVSCRRGGASAAFDELNKYFTINNMPVVPSQYWNSIHGSAKEEALQDLEGLQIMRQLGRNMAWMLKCFELGKKEAVLHPVPEEHLWTSFIR